MKADRRTDLFNDTVSTIGVDLSISRHKHQEINEIIMYAHVLLSVCNQRHEADSDVLLWRMIRILLRRDKLLKCRDTI